MLLRWSRCWLGQVALLPRLKFHPTDSMGASTRWMHSKEFRDSLITMQLRSYYLSAGVALGQGFCCSLVAFLFKSVDNLGSAAVDQQPGERAVNNFFSKCTSPASFYGSCFVLFLMLLMLGLLLEVLEEAGLDQLGQQKLRRSYSGAQAGWQQSLTQVYALIILSAFDRLASWYFWSELGSVERVQRMRASVKPRPFLTWLTAAQQHRNECILNAKSLA